MTRKRKDQLTAEERKAESRAAEVTDMKGEQYCNWCRIYLCLIMFAECIGLRVRELPFHWYDGLLVENRIGIRKEIPTLEERARILSHELAHWYLLKGEKRDLVKDPDAEQEALADRVAEIFIDLVRFSIEHGAGIPNINEI